VLTPATVQMKTSNIPDQFFLDDRFNVWIEQCKQGKFRTGLNQSQPPCSSALSFGKIVAVKRSASEFIDHLSAKPITARPSKAFDRQ
jgi:hypothetical protein